MNIKKTLQSENTLKFLALTALMLFTVAEIHRRGYAVEETKRAVLIAQDENARLAQQIKPPTLRDMRQLMVYKWRTHGSHIPSDRALTIYRELMNGVTPKELGLDSDEVARLLNHKDVLIQLDIRASR